MLLLTSISQALTDFPLSHIINYKKNGDFVIGPPYNIETILTFFCQANDVNQAMSYYHELADLKLEVA